MKSNSPKIAKKYARALFRLCSTEGRDACERALRELTEAWNQSEELRQSVQNPSFQPAERRAAIQEVAARLCESSVAQEMSNLVGVLFDNNRIDLIGKICEAFAQLQREAKRVVVAQVTSAIPLDDGEREWTWRELESKLQCSVWVEYHVDPHIIGGSIVRVGDRVLDGSVLGMLERASRSLLA